MGQCSRTDPKLKGKWSISLEIGDNGKKVDFNLPEGDLAGATFSELLDS